MASPSLPIYGLGDLNMSSTLSRILFSRLTFMYLIAIYLSEHLYTNDAKRLDTIGYYR